LAALAIGALPGALGASGEAQAGWIRVKPERAKPARHVAAHHSVRARTARAVHASASAVGAGIALGGAIQNESPAELERDFDAVGSSGARWIRMDVNWDIVQRDGPSSYNWAPFDRMVDAAGARGLHVLVTVLYTPAWARAPGGGANSPPASIANYAEFARATAVRYASRGVHAYEIWNEPNNSSFWAPRADPARYADMLQAASASIRSVDPQAVIVTGGMSPATDDSRNVAPVTFLKQLYAAGVGKSFDAVGQHPYCWPAMPGEAQGWSAWYQMDGAATSLRSVMTANGDAGKQIWATEFGAPTGGPSGSFVGEDAQAQMVTRAYKLFDSYKWAGPLFWYAARDLGTSGDTRENFFGLLRNDFTPKPAYAAFRALS
jgi:polysaccharide biosynthesis protein PslG